jgi:thiol-disulfide isomerase/thioredoxin
MQSLSLLSKLRSHALQARALVIAASLALLMPTHTDAAPTSTTSKTKTHKLSMHKRLMNFSELMTFKIGANTKAQEWTLTEFAKAQNQNVLVVIWATWCGPCLQEIPHLPNLQKEMIKHKVPCKIVTLHAEPRMPSLDRLSKTITDQLIIAHSDMILEMMDHIECQSIPLMLLFDETGAPYAWQQVGSKDLKTEKQRSAFIKELQIQFKARQEEKAQRAKAQAVAHKEAEAAKKQETSKDKTAPSPQP